MPGLAFENLPAAQQDPIQPLREQLQQTERYLKSRWNADFDALKYRGYDKQQFNNAYRQLYSKHLNLLNNARYKFDQNVLKIQQQQREQQQEVQRVQQLIQQPRERTRAEEAALRMELDPEAERLVFPPGPKPFTWQQIQSLGNFIQATAERAEEEPWKWGKKRTRESLIDQYLAAIDIVKFSDPRAFGPARQQQFNTTWNRVMKTDPRFANWFDKQGKPPVETRIATAEGPVSRAMKEKAIGKTPIGQTLTRQKKTPIEKVYGTEEEMREQYGFRPAVRSRQRPIRQRNRRTGQERISYDGGRTWQMIGR